MVREGQTTLAGGLHPQTLGRKGEGEKKEKGVEERGIPTPKLILYNSSATIIQYD
jgi:hypothetical protein